MDLSQLAIDVQGPGLRVGLSWATKKRELFVAMPEQGSLRLPRKANVQDFFDTDLAYCANLIHGDDLYYEDHTIPLAIGGSATFPYFTLRMLETYNPLHAAKVTVLGNTQVHVFRFIPFFPQNSACHQNGFDCASCPFVYPCQMSQIPLGVLVEVPLDTHSIHTYKDILRIYNAQVRGMPPDFRESIVTLWDYRELTEHPSVACLYGYKGVFQEHPELLDCFQLQRPKRRK